jgi:plasmid maintenance system antidote protein VapI
MKLSTVKGGSADFAIALEKAIGTSAEMWVRMQAEYDLWVARNKGAAYPPRQYRPFGYDQPKVCRKRL